MARGLGLKNKERKAQAEIDGLNALRSQGNRMRCLGRGGEGSGFKVCFRV